jgi:RimJ/RimL family protein N-acetyltransferase
MGSMNTKLDLNTFQLETFRDEWKSELTTWITSFQDLYLWSGKTFENGFTPSSLEKHQKRTDVKSFALTDKENNICCYGELVLGENRTGTLCRIITHPQKRGKGLGTKFCSLLIRAARDRLKLKSISLNVLGCNQNAIVCYRSVGFKIDLVRPKARKFDGTFQDLIYMSFILTD